MTETRVYNGPVSSVTFRLFHDEKVPQQEIKAKLQELCESLMNKQNGGKITHKIIVMNYGVQELLNKEAYRHHHGMLVAKIKHFVDSLDQHDLADIIEVLILLSYLQEKKIIQFAEISGQLPEDLHSQLDASWKLACGM